MRSPHWLPTTGFRRDCLFCEKQHPRLKPHPTRPARHQEKARRYRHERIELRNHFITRAFTPTLPVTTKTKESQNTPLILTSSGHQFTVAIGHDAINETGTAKLLSCIRIPRLEMQKSGTNNANRFLNATRRPDNQQELKGVYRVPTGCLQGIHGITKDN